MKKTLTSITEAVLNRFDIDYHIFPLRNGTIFFCKLSPNGNAFDIRIDDNGTIRLWKFIGISPSNIGRRCEYQNSQHRHAVVGLEVTDEGDVNLYAEQEINCSYGKNIVLIDRMISGFINMLADSSLVLSL